MGIICFIFFLELSMTTPTTSLSPTHLPAGKHDVSSDDEMADDVVLSGEDSPVKKTPKRKKPAAVTPKSAPLSQSRLPGAPTTPRTPTPATPRTLGSATKNKLACFALDVSLFLICAEERCNLTKR